MLRAIYSYSYMLSFVIILSLSGCGIKPANVILPNDAPPSHFPGTYPDPDKNLP